MAFAADHRSAAATACLAVSRQHASSQARFWTQHWVPFTNELGLDPFLATVEDKVPVLHILAHHIRDGRASRSGQPVWAERVHDEILAVVKGFTNMGLPDPRLTSYGDMDPRLTNLYTSYKNADPAPHRVKPLLIQVLHRAQAISGTAPKAQATIGMAWIAYFYLLWPSEHCKAPENSLLTLADVTLLISSTRLALLTATPVDLNRATHSSLTFDTQKNRERGEVIAHSRSGHTMACPTKSLIRRVRYLRSTGLPLATPFAPTLSTPAGTMSPATTSPPCSTLLPHPSRTLVFARPM